MQVFINTDNLEFVACKISPITLHNLVVQYEPENINFS